VKKGKKLPEISPELSIEPSDPPALKKKFKIAEDECIVLSS
jgi:hypothetical protein